MGQPCPRQQRQPSELASAGPEAASFDAAAAVAVEECEVVAGEPAVAAVDSGCVPSVCPEISCLLAHKKTLTGHILIAFPSATTRALVAGSN